MLVDVHHDREFQRYLDQMEQRLHARMVPVLAAGIRLQMSRGGVAAAAYVIGRAEPILLRHYRQVYRELFASVVAQVTKAARTGMSNFMREQLSYLEREAANRVSNISQSQADAIRDIVIAGVREGKSNDQIARELTEAIPEISRNRAATIARTETHNAAISAVHETLQFRNVTVKTKTWMTANDARVRDSHRAVHGATVPFDQPFSVGASQMMYPGDASLGAGAEEIVNCRCSVLFNTG